MTPRQVTVTGTLVDKNGVSWNNATVIAQFIPGFGTPPERYTWNGASFTQRQVIQATGNTFSVTLPSNDTILPIDSTWQFTISANPSSPAAIIIKVLKYPSGATQDISATFTAMAPPLSPTGLVIQAPDEATALALSAANPNVIYWWA